MTRGRERFDALLAGRTGGAPAWMPLIDALAARLAATGYRELTADPGLWASGLSKAGELLGADALVVGFDPTLTAEACGAELDWSAAPPCLLRAPPAVGTEPLAAARQAAMLETVRRLGATVRARCAVVAALIAPTALARQLCAELPLEEGLRRVKGAHTLVAEGLLRARPDLLLLIERWPDPGQEAPRALQRAFGTLRNLAAHYDVPVGLYVENWSESQIPGIAALRMSCYVLGSGAGDAVAAACALAAGPTAVGVSVPEDSPPAARALAAQVGAARGEGHNLFLTTSAAAGSRGDLAALRELAARLHGVAA